MLFSFRAYFYSTHKHTPEKPRLRLVVPLLKPGMADLKPVVSNLLELIAL